nr:hypothetical protein [Tanacetum cinerariifolium]
MIKQNKCKRSKKKSSIKESIQESEGRGLGVIGTIGSSSGTFGSLLGDEAVNEKMDDSLVRATTTASNLEVEQDSGNIIKTRSKATPNEPVSQETSSGGGLRYQETIGDTITQTRVLDLENTKTTQALEIDSLKRRVKKLEKKQRSRTHKLKRLYKVGLSARVDSSEVKQSLGEDASKQGRKIDDIDADEGITLVDETAKNQERTTTTISSKKSHDKGKAKMIEELVQLKKKNQILLDEEVAKKLQAEINEQERLGGERAQQELEANIALIETWDDVQAKIDVDYQLAQRLQAEVQEELTDKEKARLFVHLLEKIRKFFAAKRAKEKRNKLPTRAQQRSIMCTYLKNMEGWKSNNLKNKSKRAREEFEQENAKKQKIDDDKEIVELKQLEKIIPDEEWVAIDVIPLAVKPQSIVEWKIHKEGKKSYYQIIKVDGSSKKYLVFSHMLKDFDKEDVETLWKLVKAKHGSILPEEDYERVLWGDLKVMFDSHVEDEV